MKIQFTRIMIWAGFSLCLSSCLGGGNSGSETTNGLTGVITDPKGMPVQGARVTLLPQDYNPYPGESQPELEITKTDAKGVYRFNDIIPGQYNLALADTAQGLKALLQGFSISPGSEVASLSGILEKPQDIRIRIADYIGNNGKGYVFIPGSTVWAKVDSNSLNSGSVDLKGVPPGIFDRIQLAIDLGADRKIITLAENIKVNADSASAILPYQAWKFSRPIPLSTLTLDLNKPVTAFPMLIRLDAGNFDFKEADPDGRDLRFSNASQKPLPFQIERWDLIAKRAEIWVLVDTLRAKSATEYINMHWGRSLVLADLPGPKVFENGAGFAAVYHFNEAATDEPGGYKDVTANANHLTADIMNASAQVPGIIGGAKSFCARNGVNRGTLSGAIPKGIGENSPFTVSFWMRFDTTSARSTILDFGITQTMRDMHFLIRSDHSAQFGGLDLYPVSGNDLASWQNSFSLNQYVGKWIYVTTVYDPGKTLLSSYINGELVAESISPAFNIDATGGLRLGKAILTIPTDSQFDGDLDELRFYTQVLPPERIKLEYLNQKPLK